MAIDGKYLSTEGQLHIANKGGTFEETGDHSWNGKQIKKGSKVGTVIKDENGAYRVLTIKFEDKIDKLILNNVGPDEDCVHDYEFKLGDAWVPF